MRNFHNHNRSDSRGGYRDERRETFRAVCSSCGADCTVPFKPNGRKPVFCNACFKKNADNDDSRSFQDRDSRRSSFSRRPDYGNRQDFVKRHDFRPQNDEMLEKLNRKLDKIIELMTANHAKTIPSPVATPKKKNKHKKEVLIAAEQKSETAALV